MSYETKGAMPANPPGACYPFSRGEVSLESVLRTGFSDDCEVDLRRRLTDFRPVSADTADQTEARADCPIVAAVYTKSTRLVVALAVYYNEVSGDELAAVREFCTTHGIRLFTLERLESYQVDILERSSLCEQLGLDPVHAPNIIPAARCPKCNSPLVHKIKPPTARRNGLYYACPSHLDARRPCSGFLCGADEIFEYYDSSYRDTKYRMQIDLWSE